MAELEIPTTEGVVLTREIAGAGSRGAAAAIDILLWMLGVLLAVSFVSTLGSIDPTGATGFVRGFGLRDGAIASTVCHDHHNIACVGVDYADMAVASNRLGQIEGGFVVVKDGEVLAELALPVAGLMSLAPFEKVREGLEDLRAAARDLGVTLNEPFLQLAFLALPVIPALKITDRGMVDVMKFEIIP